MSKLHKCLLAVEVYEFTGDEIGELRKQYKHDRYLDGILPKYSFNQHNGFIADADSCFYYVEEGKEKHLMFNISTVDRLLQEEISMGGIEDVLKDIDLRPFLKHLKKHSYKDFQRSLNSAEYLVIQLEYIGGGYYNPDDVDLLVSVEGVLYGNNLTLIESTNEN